jgi:hypothetical protein
VACPQFGAHIDLDKDQAGSQMFGFQAMAQADSAHPLTPVAAPVG